MIEPWDSRFFYLIELETVDLGLCAVGFRLQGQWLS